MNKCMHELGNARVQIYRACRSLQGFQAAASVHCAPALSAIAVMWHPLFLPFFRLHLHLFCEYYLQIADKVLRNDAYLRSQKKSVAGLGSTSGAVRALYILLIKCVNYKNQSDCIIDTVCSLFSDRGVTSRFHNYVYKY